MKIADKSARPSSENAPLFSIPVRVYYEDTDAAGVVYYANYLKFFERCRTEWVRAAGYGQAELAADHGVAFVVRKAGAAYMKPARLDDLLSVDLQIESMGRARINLIQRVVKQTQGGEMVMVKGLVELACVQAATFKPIEIPSFLRDKLQESL
jgi:acyl-CoA thioester hydrolase